jgi:hypothetical protein
MAKAASLARVQAARELRLESERGLRQRTRLQRLTATKGRAPSRELEQQVRTRARGEAPQLQPLA